MQVDLGNVPEWVAALGTAGALIGTLVLLKHELDERRLREGSRVAAWVGDPVYAKDIPDPWIIDYGHQADDLIGWRVWVANAGDTPVFGVRVRVGDRPRLPREFTHHYGIIAPGDRRSKLIGSPDLNPAECIVDWVAEVAFTDSSGRHWLRLASGKLNELKNPPPLKPR